MGGVYRTVCFTENGCDAPPSGFATLDRHHSFGEVDPRSSGGKEMNTKNSAMNHVLRVVGLAMAVAVVVLTILDSVPLEANLIMLGIGLFAISIEAISSRTS
jgi:hypothetical protein